MKYVVARGSPRRRELLKQIIDDFEICPAEAEEKVNLSLFPDQIACALAESKCDEAFRKYPEATVIGCDTIVVFQNEILGKPKDREDAFNTLKKLSGRYSRLFHAIQCAPVAPQSGNPHTPAGHTSLHVC